MKTHKNNTLVKVANLVHQEYNLPNTIYTWFPDVLDTDSRFPVDEETSKDTEENELRNNAHDTVKMMTVRMKRSTRSSFLCCSRTSMTKGSTKATTH